jgi:hypothetical protein
MLQVVNPAYEQAYRETASKYLVSKRASSGYQDVFKTQIKQGLHEDKIHNARSFWYNPATDYRLVEKSPEGYRPKLQSIYFGESYDRSRPTWEVKALDYGAYSNYLKSANASTDRKESRFDSVIGCFGNEIAEDAYNYLRAVEADVITSGDFSNMQVLTSFIDILDIQLRQFSLVNAVTTKATNTLNIQTANYNRFQITEEIGELEAPEGRKGQFSTQTFKLKKAGGQIAYSDEALMQNWSAGINPIDYATQNLASDVVRVKAKKIATALASLTTSGAATGDFSAFASSGTLADKRPLLIFGGMFNEIYMEHLIQSHLITGLINSSNPILISHQSNKA